jgi:ribosomal protein L37AE/L43A
MKKYGVVINKEHKTKTASEDTVCPVCKIIVWNTSETGIPYCTRCGTEPFEKRRDKDGV